MTIGLAMVCWALPAPAADVDKAVQQIVQRTNSFRETHGRGAVAPNGKLADTAHDFARFMANSGKFGHTADGRQPAQRASAHHYEYCIVAENIAYFYRSDGYDTPELAAEMVKGWENSPEHRKNMLDAAVTETGVGIAQDADGRYFGVQMFGRPRSGAIRFTVRNRAGQKIGYRTGQQRFSLPPSAERTHTVCRPTRLAIDLPRPFSASPGDGASYVVVERRGGLAVKEP
jgi:hypothetical protein